MRLLLALAVGLAISTVSLAATAYGNGAPGYTGKQGTSCTSCHTGAAAKPTVTITGPATLAAGATGDFQMVVTTNIGRGAGGIAATDGTTLVAGTGFQEGSGELSHVSALATSGGKATFSFKVTAPATGTTLKLYAVGMGSNGSGTGGDGVTQITKDIAVTGGGAATPATPTTPTTPAPATPAGAGDDEAEDTASPASTTPAKATTTPAKKKKKAADDDDDENSNERRTIDPYADRGGCSTSRAPLDASGASVAAMVLVALGLVRRRSRRPS